MSKLFLEQNGNRLRARDGGTIRVDAGATLDVAAGATVNGIVAAAAASEISAGSIEIATNAEADAGVAADKAVVPSNLPSAVLAHMPDATDAVKGKVELASDAEAIAVTVADKALVPANLAAVLGKLKLYSFTGSNGAGACGCTGLQVGDMVLGVSGITTGALGDLSAAFETVITVVDQLQQSAVENYSTKNFTALVYRPS
jgi:hypothetical protein